MDCSIKSNQTIRFPPRPPRIAMMGNKNTDEYGEMRCNLLEHETDEGCCAGVGRRLLWRNSSTLHDSIGVSPLEGKCSVGGNVMHSASDADRAGANFNLQLTFRSNLYILLLSLHGGFHFYFLRFLLRLHLCYGYVGLEMKHLAAYLFPHDTNPQPTKTEIANLLQSCNITADPKVMEIVVLNPFSLTRSMAFIY
jgi:hypothetical protein